MNKTGSSAFTEDVSVGDGYRKKYFSSLEDLINVEKEAKEAERNAFFTPEKVMKNREGYVKKLKELIGYPLFDRKNGAFFKKIRLGEDDDCEIYRYEFFFEKGIVSYGLFFVPLCAFGKLPLVVCVHGGEGTPELMSGMYGSNHYSDIVRRFVRKGCCVFAPALMVWNTSDLGKKYSRSDMDARMKALGSSMTSFECELIRGETELISGEDAVDGSRRGVAGLSYGAYYSMFLAALETDFKAAYVSGIVNDRLKFVRPDFLYTGQAGYMLDHEICGLICPRALYVEAGRHDAFFDWRTAKSEAEKTSRFYSECGYASKFVFSLTEEGHKYSPYDDGIDFVLSHLE